MAITTILVELGDLSGPTAWHRASDPKERMPSSRPRFGDVADLYQLQHTLGYDVYRLNIAVGREIYDWRGHDMNGPEFNHDKIPQLEGLEALYGVRVMRKLERVLPTLPLQSYATLMTKGVSFLATRVPLAEPALHHVEDLEYIAGKFSAGEWRRHGQLAALNQGNPALVRVRAHQRGVWREGQGGDARAATRGRRRRRDGNA